MIGIDTSFLVAWTIKEHVSHNECRSLFHQALEQGETFTLTAGILAEFIHVVTDPRRFENPLTMPQATEIAALWQGSAEVALLSPDDTVIAIWLDWLEKYSLGRKRLLDTLIAATWRHAGITQVFTLNPADFVIFSHFTCYPQASPA